MVWPYSQNASRTASQKTLNVGVGRSQLEDNEQDGLIISRILVGTVWDFIQAKCSLRWGIERCGGLIWSCCPRNPLGKAEEEKKKA